MNLTHLAAARDDAGRPIKVGLIGAGKFGSMFLAQVPTSKGIEVTAIADLDPDRAHRSCREVGWTGERVESVDFTDDSSALFTRDDVEVIVEATGNPAAGVEHALLAIEHGKHIVMVNVEADVLAGAYLADKARQAGIVYSMAYGDQPALTAELVDWARTAGFSVVAAGRGHKWLPEYRHSTPETVWKHWGLTDEQAERGRLNPKMFNAFLDGSKPAIESAAIANATGLDVPTHGLTFPPGATDDIPTLMRPKSEGGELERKGMVEVISCLTRDGEQIAHDIRKGVWVCFEADTDYLKNCFEEYKWITDPSGRYMCSYKRWHMIGLELAISIASIGLRGEATGHAVAFKADACAIAKRDLKAGEVLDGEGGYTVAGGLRPAEVSVANGYVPLGLAHSISLKNAVPDGQPVTWDDVVADETTTAYKLRREIEAW